MNRRNRKTVYFELQERIPLNENLAEIIAVHNVEIEPVIEMISEYASYRIKGYLNFFADYEGRRAEKKVQSGKEAKRYKVLDSDPLEPFLIEREADHRKKEHLVVKHRIPVDISLPADRVDENGIELEITALDYQLLQPRFLLVSATVALSGVLEDEPVYSGQEEATYFTENQEEATYYTENQEESTNYTKNQEENTYFTEEQEKGSFFPEDDEEIRIEKNELWDQHLEIQLAGDPYAHAGFFDEPGRLPEAIEAEAGAAKGDSALQPAGAASVKDSGAESSIAEVAKGDHTQSAKVEEVTEQNAIAEGAKGKPGVEVKAEAKEKTEARAKEDTSTGAKARLETESADHHKQPPESIQNEDADARKTSVKYFSEARKDTVKESQNQNIEEKSIADFSGRAEEEKIAGLEATAPEAAFESDSPTEEESGSKREVKVSISNKSSIPASAGEDGEETRLPDQENPDEEPRKSQTAQLLTQFLLNREEKMAQMRICLLQPGETLSEIARRYSVDEIELIEANGLQDGSRIPGRVIKIPLSKAKSR